MTAGGPPLVLLPRVLLQRAVMVVVHCGEGDATPQQHHCARYPQRVRERGATTAVVFSWSVEPWWLPHVLPSLSNMVGLSVR